MGHDKKEEQKKFIKPDEKKQPNRQEHEQKQPNQNQPQPKKNNPNW